MVALPVKKTGKGGLGGMLGSAKATTGGQKFSSKKERRDKERDTVAPTSADAIRPQVCGPHPSPVVPPRKQCARIHLAGPSRNIRSWSLPGLSEDGASLTSTLMQKAVAVRAGGAVHGGLPT
jgi:hypothetical protein